MANKQLPDIDETVQKYFKELKCYKPLTKEKEQKLLRNYHNEGNIMARDLLIKSNLKYACSIANSYRGRGVSLVELISEANNGLMEAIDKYDLSKDVKVITYAKWWIMQRLNNCINTTSKYKADELPSDHERWIGDVEFGDVATTLSKEFVVEDFDDDKTEDGKKEYVNSIMSCLSERERDILSLYYGLNGSECTLEEIGDKYGLTKERIRQILENSLTKARSAAMVMVKSNFD